MNLPWQQLLNHLFVLSHCTEKKLCFPRNFIFFQLFSSFSELSFFLLQIHILKWEYQCQVRHSHSRITSKHATIRIYFQCWQLWNFKVSEIRERDRRKQEKRHKFLYLFTIYCCFLIVLPLCHTDFSKVMSVYINSFICSLILQLLSADCSGAIKNGKSLKIILKAPELQSPLMLCDI